MIRQSNTTIISYLDELAHEQLKQINIDFHFASYLYSINTVITIISNFRCHFPTQTGSYQRKYFCSSYTHSGLYVHYSQLPTCFRKLFLRKGDFWDSRWRGWSPHVSVPFWGGKSPPLSIWLKMRVNTSNPKNSLKIFITVNTLQLQALLNT